MSLMAARIVDAWAVRRNTASAGTAITGLIPPYTGSKGASRKLFAVDTGRTISNSTQTALTGAPNWMGDNDCFTHITDITIITGSTSHSLFFMRPLNWTYITAAVAANATTALIKEDPGVYSTNYRYPSPLATGTAAVADNTIASGDFVAYQLKDGTWILDTTTGLSGSTLTFSTAVPNITGGGIAAGTPLFFFGVITDKDPATGLLHFAMDTPVSLTPWNVKTDTASLFSSLHRGDPIMIHNANATAADTHSGISGVYTKDW